MPSALEVQRINDIQHASPVGQVMGESMKRLAVKHETALERLAMTGQCKPYTVINKNPFIAKVESPYIGYFIPRRDPQTGYGFKTISEPLFCFPYHGIKSDGSREVLDFDAIPILPAEQASEFYVNFMERGQDQKGYPIGGIFVYEGKIDEYEKATDKTMVSVPKIARMKDGSTIVTVEKKNLREIERAADEALRQFTLASVQEANEWSKNPRMSNNVHDVHRRYAHFALEMEWIAELPNWVQAQTKPENLCPRCRTEVRPDAYMCGECGKVFDPVRAYEEGDIQWNHVSFEKLDAAGWKKVKAIKKQRDKMKLEADSEDETKQ